MSIQKELKSIFLPEQAASITEALESLYYEELIQEYETFYYTGEISEEFFSSMKNNDTIKYITQLESPQNDYVATMLVLKYLQGKAATRTEEAFMQCVKEHDMKTLKRILKYNDPDGIYNRMVTEIYK